MADRISILFIGGGVAAHLYALVAAHRYGAKQLAVTMVDPIEDAPDRNLCVWGPPEPLLQDALIVEWSRVQFGYGRSTITKELHTLTYRHYSAKSIRKVVDTRMQVNRILAHHSTVDRQVDVALDSRPSTVFHRDATLSLQQHFHGWRIQTDADTFDPDVMTMMDFRVDQSNGVCFIYVLPYSRTDALVECTVFSSEPWQKDMYESRLSAYISDNLSCSTYEILSTETGSIPMCDAIPDRKRGEHWFSIGSAAGLTKATTGYTVARCIRDAEHLFDTQQRTGVWSIPQRPSRRFDWYDRLLLRIIRDEPERVPGIFWALFNRNPIELILRFLDEETSLFDEIRVFWSLPWSPFLRAIFRR